ncbi:MAG: aryl-sulfate sulfotransferase, partial [Winogradskyella sp.]|nr:aryl-sulfate sulfotransferase [Winogradskyella sp.]
DNNLLWTFTYSTNDHRLHHDIYPMPNGNILLLAAEVIPGPEAIQSGRNPALLVDNELYNERIFEIEPVGTNQANVVWEWNSKDHLIQDFDATKDNFGVVSENPQRIDVNFLNGGSGSNNWLHINSIQYDETRDQIVISARNLSELWIIDHSTTNAESASSSGGTYGKGGDLLYRWGNPEAYRQGTSNDRTLFGQHYPHYIDPGLPNEGKIIIFNNGFQRTPSFSQVDIITPPESTSGFYDYVQNTAYGPIATDYTYSDMSTDPSEFYSAIVSSAQQLPGGNLLVCEGNSGFIFELDSNDNIVWEYKVPVSNGGNVQTQGSTDTFANLIFRALKHPLNYSAFNGRDLTPGSPIELNPDLTPCNNLSVNEFNSISLEVFPNPTRNSITIKGVDNIDSTELYNALGQKVATSNKKVIDLSAQPNGFYFLIIQTGNTILTHRIVKN